MIANDDGPENDEDEENDSDKHGEYSKLNRNHYLLHSMSNI